MKSIIMHPSDARASADGKKTRTTRLIMAPRGLTITGLCTAHLHGKVVPCPHMVMTSDGTEGGCRYGNVGDFLWIRESWAPIGDSRPSGYWTNPKMAGVNYWYEAKNDKPTWGGEWQDARLMPFEAARLFVRLIDVKAMRLQDITSEEAQAEGFEPVPVHLKWAGPRELGQHWSARKPFAEHWDTINPKSPWASNPFVWSLAYEVWGRPSIEAQLALVRSA